MALFNTILYQFRVISSFWWVVIGMVAILLFIFRHKREQLIGNLLIIYVLIIFSSTVFSREPIGYTELQELVNLDLVGTWQQRITGDHYGNAEILLNFCMLLPVGILFPWTTKKGIVPTALSGLSLIMLIELSQLLTKRGYFELTDIVDNTLGSVIGYGLFCIGKALWRKREC